MSERSATHDTFTLERVYHAAPARVFAAWSNRDAKARWTGCHVGASFEMDFRVGGRDIFRGGPAGGPVYLVETLYHDIVPDQRIVLTYDMYADDTRISVSLQTIEFKPEGAGTRLIFTEQGVYLDGHAVPAHREHGTGSALDRLADELSDQSQQQESAT
ncbi:MAG: SRPBCC family protein [Actinomycetota bacterium]